MKISKTQYIKALQCPKALWRKKHGIEADAGSTSDTDALFATGYTVGDYAKERFPGGLDMTQSPFDIPKMLKATKAAIACGEETIYEASFIFEGIFVAIDILRKTPQGWLAYEVKSSTKVKKHHLDDLAIQYYVASQHIDIAKTYLMHINSSYERLGSIDLEQLLHAEDCTDIAISKQAEIELNLDNFSHMLAANEEPDIDIGLHCSSPYPCEYKSQCWKHIPNPSVFNLYRMSMTNKLNLYTSGSISLEQIPEHYKLTKIQTQQVEASSSGKITIDHQKITSFIDTIEYPISFFDFETFQNAIPRFNRQKPYMQIPFQYSLHILDNNDTLKHLEYLGDENTDPRRELAERMLADLPATGSIVAYNQSFEIVRIKELAALFPDLKDALLALNKRFVDLIIPFRNGSYYHPEFNGSFSIKKVLPALFPNDDELNYKKLEISNGGMAMDTFANLYKLKDVSKREEIRNDLLAYCHLDTLAMVRIFEKLNTKRNN